MFRRFFDAATGAFCVGGVETYIRHLSNLAVELGLRPHVFQPAERAFTVEIDSVKVSGHAITHLDAESQKRVIFEEIVKRSGDDDIIVFGADHHSVRTERPRTISIQHGIDWDLPVSPRNRVVWLAPEERMRREHNRRIKRAIRYFENCRNTVCVDHNFPNWYRATTGRSIDGNVWVIPNFGVPAAPEQLHRNNDVLRVLFARRFEPYRGTRVMAAAVESVLAARANIHVTFAGEGPDDAYLREKFGGCPRVRFTVYDQRESMGIHLAHDVAVIPSLGSEGTTLSAAEAMGAGCAVIASAVGGLTNMILDGYNGLLITPRSEDLAAAILRLADDAALRESLARRGYDTATQCFSIEKWKQNWTSVLHSVAAEP
jgi:glycosyltransferase involved in cell wall biosynthesis